MANLAGPLQRQEGVYRLGQRHFATPMQEIKVKPVGIQATQATLAGGDGVLAGRILRIDLAHQKDLIASAVDRLGNELLGLALAIHLGCIDEGEAEVET